MEHHESVYEQIIDANNTQETEYITGDLVQQIVVENDNNQPSAVDCEMSNMEIMLPNDCINVQDQCSSNITIPSSENINEKKTENEVSQLNNTKDNVTENIGNHSKEKIEECVTQNPTTYHQENNEKSNTTEVTKTENESKKITSETNIETKKSVMQSNVESVSISTDNQLISNHSDLNNCQNNETKHNDLKEIKQKSEKNSTDLKEVSVNTSILKETSEPTKVEKIKEVFCENIGECDQSQNHVTSDNSNSNCTNNQEMHSKASTQIAEKTECPVLVSEIISETKIVTHSDDVAILTEFNSLEYDNVISEADFDKSEEISVKISDKNHKKIEEPESKKEHQLKIGASTLSDNLITEETNQQLSSVNDSSLYTNPEEDEDDLELHLSAQSTDNRKVIQDIFDDWQDENVEEDNNQTEHQDSVELELQNLLNDEAHDAQTLSNINTSGHAYNNYENYKSMSQNNASTPVKAKDIKSEKISPTKRKGSSSPKPVSNSTKDQSLNRSKSQEQADSKLKHQSPRPGVKIPGHHLTSQIASTAEVNEVLKERLREKQKDLVTPKTADLVFVKKITQRLSSQLAGVAAASALPPIVLPSFQSEDDKIKSDKSADISKSSTTDNKELLAILEGDDDPDWSDLRPQSVVEENNKTLSPGDGSKLNPDLERELALKQLQELPNISTKKSPGAPKKTKRSSTKSLNKSDNKLELKSTDEETKIEAASPAESADEDVPKKEKTSKTQKENNNQNVQNDSIELNVEESRSGRKRKLTEKAREHELTVKRQKVVKGKAAENKKKEQSQESVESKTSEVETSAPSSPKPVKTKSDLKSSKAESKSAKSEEKVVKSEAKSTATTETKTNAVKGRRPKQLGLTKKDVTISKRKLAVKNLLRQKMANKKAAVKAKIQTIRMETDEISAKSTSEKPAGAPVGRPKKAFSEIDKLLQDEGVVNLLYDVEQPDSRRLVPITKSQKKIMDVEKAERELKLRTKLVRNAVMRLRNSSTSTAKISPRSRRNVPPSQQSAAQAEKKSAEPSRSPKTSVSTTASTDFIIPAKIRNAADASRIIRRHSSSSFSSASASPRVSVDLPPEAVPKMESPESPAKTKRKLSQELINEKIDKRNKKKSLSKTESEDETPTGKKEPLKKSTRSNAVSALSPKSPKIKKVPKSRTSLDSGSSDVKTSPRSQDEITACLAEAASALLASTSTSRSSSASVNRKKGSINLVKADEEKLDVKKLFNYKEINVKQHGYLVQLILTPSTLTSGIRNAITIQVMKELREALLILKKFDECRVVLFTSTGTSFCEGLDVSSLLSSNKEERKHKAEEMANTVKQFIQTLAAFNKPIVAGIQGAAIGLGVTMLPLFDLVIASDKATFSTPYGKLGQIAEGAAILTLSHSLGSAVTNELLLGGRTLTASEALRAGLVTRVLWPDRFPSELLPSLKSMSEQSSQSMEATKALLRYGLRKQLDIALESETFLLIEHWSSSECQQAIKAYIDEKGL